MRPDRLATVLRVRELVERRRLAELGDSRRAGLAAEASVRSALEARAQTTAPGSSLTPRMLVADRVARTALDDAVVRTRQQATLADQAIQAAEQRRAGAAIDRRSVERLAERRAALAAREAGRLEQRSNDAVALETFRRRP